MGSRMVSLLAFQLPALCLPTHLSLFFPVEARCTASTVSGLGGVGSRYPPSNLPQAINPAFPGLAPKRGGNLKGAGTSGFQLQTPPRPQPSKPLTRVLEVGAAASISSGY